MTISPFTIAIEDEVLADLHERLRRTRWPDAVEDPDGIYGAGSAAMIGLRDYWLKQFDWRSVERKLNSSPNFMYDYGAGRLHFLHARGRGPDPLPLLFSHGWPGSILEARKLIPLLTDPARYGGDARDSFDVIVPSLPGFGFSTPAQRPGMNTFAMADLFAQLMTELGYAKFIAQGGDFGANISSVLALRHAGRVSALHLNYMPGTYQPFVAPGEALSAEESAFLASARQWSEEHGAYAHVQAREPDTLALALNDSPMGSAAWLVDKFERWSEHGFDQDELLAHVTLYWVTGSIASSCRLYVESRRAPLRFTAEDKVTMPCAIAHFPKEEPFPPRAWIERGYSISRWTEMPAGGHFAALEQPELLAQDLREFCRPLRA